MTKEKRGTWSTDIYQGENQLFQKREAPERSKTQRKFLTGKRRGKKYFGKSLGHVTESLRVH